MIEFFIILGICVILLPSVLINFMTKQFNKKLIPLEQKKNRFYKFKTEQTECSSFRSDIEFESGALIAVSSATNQLIYMDCSGKANMCSFDQVSHISVKINPEKRILAIQIIIFFINGDSVAIPFIENTNDAFRLSTLIEHNLGKDPFSRDRVELSIDSIID